VSRLLTAIALLGATSLSVPAFAAQDCLAYCQEGVGARGIIARLNATRNASNETEIKPVPRSAHTGPPLLTTGPWRGCRVNRCFLGSKVPSLHIGRDSCREHY
jgi:hypothetical protein